MEDIGQQLVEAMGGQEPTVEAPAEQAPVAQEPVVEQVPAFDPTQFDNTLASQTEQIQAIAQQMEQLNGRIPEPQAPAPTEQEVIAQELKKQLGIDGLEGKLTEQEKIIQAQNEQLAQYQAFQQQQQAQQEFAKLESEFGQFDKEVLQNKIMEIGQTNPQLAEALNSPEGARMLLSQGVGIAQRNPDPVTPSSNNTDVGADQTLDRIREGQATQDDFGQALLGYLA